MFIGLGWCPLTGYSPGLLLVSLLDTVRRHFYINGADRQSICWRCGSEDTSAHILFACQALATLTHTYLVSLFFDPEDVRSLSLGAIWYFIRGAKLP
jgi:hypothetical protein